MNQSPPESDVAAVRRCQEVHDAIREELSKVIVGQNDVIEQVLIAMLARGHALLEGVPGLAKTLLVSSIADSLHLTFKRIQFTPDLMPSDVTGTDVIQEDLQTGERAYNFLAGPIFANMILADEINRTPPKTQAAMLEAMQERQVSAGGNSYKVPDPFFVLATQNPLEQEGTYPLPEAQLDRFLLYIRVDYPSGAEEWEIARRVTTGQMGFVKACVSGQRYHRPPTAGHADSGQRPGARIRLGTGASDAAQHRRSARLREPMGQLGSRPAWRAHVGHLRQGPCDVVRAIPRQRGRRPSGREARVASPHCRQLCRPGQQYWQRAADRHADGSRASG